jgi:hypothetical protein
MLYIKSGNYRWLLMYRILEKHLVFLDTDFLRSPTHATFTECMMVSLSNYQLGNLICIGMMTIPCPSMHLPIKRAGSKDRIKVGKGMVIRCTACMQITSPLCQYASPRGGEGA